MWIPEFGVSLPFLDTILRNLRSSELLEMSDKNKRAEWSGQRNSRCLPGVA